MTTDVVLETQRMILRQLSSADVPPMTQILINPEVMRYSVRGVLGESATAEFIDWSLQSYAHHGFGPWAVVEKASGVLMGFCALNRESVDGVEEVEIGYRLAPQFWGRGLATEIVRATLGYGFEHLGLRSIIAIVQPANVASVRVIQKVGFNAFVYSQYHRLGVKIYRLNRDEWLAEETS
ncbi:GNAT family N-acetyltransferase [Pseudomonas sp. CDFA 553]|uniref:GNAT family N-acetyltransferase n=1 Tax=Pseudomonas quasicaspiana TaxID=2829821 RepID=UPI001E5F0B66|nr:GNAT family N-acetyltransferase [Pseudomonas quasicaspiana]MCD5991765.1 GNAT family N-acetyltransferase [Pseudomonas quasicaspiana]